MVFATEQELKNNLEYYLNEMTAGNEIIIERNGEQIGRLVPQGKVMQSLTESLRGFIKENIDFDKEREKILREKYEITD
ncbi:MAG: hypothetical protein IJ728_07410 [Selenomonadaceae bacterium]|nr:hypothetical protein [Selenomonadaceae bacterium]